MYDLATFNVKKTWRVFKSPFPEVLYPEWGRSELLLGCPCPNTPTVTVVSDVWFHNPIRVHKVEHILRRTSKVMEETWSYDKWRSAEKTGVFSLEDLGKRSQEQKKQQGFLQGI